MRCIDTKTGAVILPGVRYPERGGNRFRLVRYDADRRRLLLCVEPAATVVPLWDSNPFLRHFNLRCMRDRYVWLPIDRCDGDRICARFPLAPLARFLTGR